VISQQDIEEAQHEPSAMNIAQIGSMNRMERLVTVGCVTCPLTALRESLVLGEEQVQHAGAFWQKQQSRTALYEQSAVAKRIVSCTACNA
jgi:hypothetical protein